MIDISKIVQGEPWQTAYAEIERCARAYLSHSARDQSIGTTVLAEALLPPALIRGAGMEYCRKRIFKGLMALAKHELADCVTRGEPFKHRGLKRVITPLRWRAPDPSYRKIGPREMQACDL